MLSKANARGIDVNCFVKTYSICEYRSKNSQFDYNSYDLAFKKRGSNMKLSIKPESQKKVKSIDECFKTCASDKDCKSFAYHKSKK